MYGVRRDGRPGPPIDLPAEQAAQLLVAFSGITETIVPDWIRAGFDQDPDTKGTFDRLVSVGANLGEVLDWVISRPETKADLDRILANGVIILDKGFLGLTDAYEVALEAFDRARSKPGAPPSRDRFRQTLQQKLGVVEVNQDDPAILTEIIYRAIDAFDIRRLDPDGPEPWSAAKELASRIAQALHDNERKPPAGAGGGGTEGGST